MASEILKTLLSIAAVLMIAISTYLAAKDAERKVGQTPLTLDPSSNKPSWLSKHRLIVAIALAAILGIAQQLLIRRETLESAQRAEATALDARSASVEAKRAAQNAGEAASKAEAAATNAALAVEEISKTADTLLALSKDVQLAKQETLRVSDRITNVSLELWFAIRISDPRISSYKARLDEGIREFNEKYPTTEESEDHIGFYGMGVRGRSPVWLDFTHTLAPNRQTEGEVWRALFVTFIELAFYRTPITPEEFSFTRAGDISSGKLPPRKHPPDLSLAASNKGNTFVYVTHRQDRFGTSLYRLWFRKWSPPLSEWVTKTRRVTFMDDLPNSQMLLAIGNIPKRSHESEFSIRRDLEIEYATLEINNTTIELNRDSFIKHFDANDNPVWELVFPKDLSTILSPGV